MKDSAVEAAALGRKFGGRTGSPFARSRGRAPGSAADPAPRGPGRGTWALRECTVAVPAGRICAVVGPNGAGKSTLLAHAAGLLRPTEGSIRVLGTAPVAARERLAYVAQDKPLHPRLTVEETLRLGRELNPGRWDQAAAERVAEDGLFADRTRVGRLSGGQRTRLALALALGKRPELLLLDEPMADLDPLARHELMGLLLAEAAENGTTVLMSSHILGELATACDHLVLLGAGRVRLAGEVEEVLAAHTLVTGRGSPADLDGRTVVESRATGRGLTALLRTSEPLGAGWESAAPSLEEILLGYLRTLDEAPAAEHTAERVPEEAAS
ncbi:ABC transporter ATP-binding protein [Streptomyces physcomitrii]|uniref:ABC transporter ATP-binding protein n=1 Tax=Streptomyces physcomitrii TaxID=2724184 RepID=A0ABX1H8S6_9ACTN|nr:ABC transporter ATP-binding protein [Streptomyces physcomitrii]NKI44747.1 ABC transporter ATP-binding protein [Streptomyces physcomitrii]